MGMLATVRWQRHRIAEIGRFGSVGVIGLAIELLVFNALLFAVLDDAPWVAKIVSTIVAGTVCYFLNRSWTWAHRARTGVRRELPLFLVVSALGLMISEVCLVASHYGFGLTSKLDDNLSANGAGLVLATLFRYWAYKRFVFLEGSAPSMHAASDRGGAEVAA